MNTTHVDGSYLWTCLMSEGHAFSYITPTVNHVILCVLNVFLSFSTTFLNAMTMFIYWRSSQLQKKTSYFLIMLLSLSDFVVGAVCNPVYAVLLIKDLKRDGNCPLGAVFPMISFALFGMSSTVVFLLNLERYLSVVHPIFHRRKVTKFRILIASFVIWCPFAVNAYILIVDEKLGRIILSIKICIFLITLIFIYAKIFRAGRETARNRISDDGTVSKKAFLRNIKLAKSCLIVLCCTFLCFLPMAITSSMTNSFSKLDLVGRIMWSWSITLIFSSSTLNSVIFFWRNEILRNEAKTILRQTWVLSWLPRTNHMATDQTYY